MEKRLIDANALMDMVEGVDWYHTDDSGHLYSGANPEYNTPLYKAEDIYDAIRNAPTIDAVEVVRCGECKHQIIKIHIPSRYCEVWQGYVGHGDDGYCAYGERRTEDD